MKAAGGLARLEPVDKRSLQYAFAAFGLELSQSDYTRITSTLEEQETRQANPQYDWAEAPDVSVFFGRSEELLQLRQWILEERCRLIALLGIGGILPFPTPYSLTGVSFIVCDR